MVTLTSEADVQPFLNRETLESDLDFLRKDELLLISDYVNLGLTKQSKKEDIRSAIKEKLGFGGKDIAGDLDDDYSKFKLHFELKKLEIEERAREREERAKEREYEERENEKRRQHEIQLAQLRVPRDPLENSGVFDVARNIKLLPKFCEDEVSKFFVTFEKIANQLKWPREHWSIMMQVAFIGKAQVAYSSLSPEDSVNYDIVRRAILHAYELVPEAYRQKFRDLKRSQGQTFMEFARLKQRLFDEWLESKKVKEIKSLKELLLLEEFKNCLHGDLKAHLEEVKVETLDEAARISDEYVLTHKVSNITKHQMDEDFTSYSKEGGMSSPEIQRSRKSDVVCYHCGEVGHMMAQCFQKKNGRARGPQGTLSITHHNVGEAVYEKNAHKDLLDKFGPFLLKGAVSPLDRLEDSKAITILRDTGSEQTIILESALPPNVVVDGNEVVLLGGFPNNVVSCPLVTVSLSSPLVNKSIKVAVAKELPVKGVEMLLANDVAMEVSTDSPIAAYNPLKGGTSNAKQVEEHTSRVSVAARHEFGSTDYGSGSGYGLSNYGASNYGPSGYGSGYSPSGYRSKGQGYGSSNCGLCGHALNYGSSNCLSNSYGSSGYDRGNHNSYDRRQPYRRPYGSKGFKQSYNQLYGRKPYYWRTY